MRVARTWLLVPWQPLESEGRWRRGDEVRLQRSREGGVEVWGPLGTGELYQIREKPFSLHTWTHGKGLADGHEQAGRGRAWGRSTGFHRESLSGPLGAEGDWAMVAAGWAGLTGKGVPPVDSIAPLLPPQRFSFLSSSSHLNHVFHLWSE